MLGLRRAEGARWEDIAVSLSDERLRALSEQVEMLVNAKLMTYDGKVLRLTQKGLVVENQIIVRLGL